MNFLHFYLLFATLPKEAMSYVRGIQHRSHTMVCRSTTLARNPAQREMQTSIAVSMLFAVFAMLVTAGMFVSSAKAANGFGTTMASTGLNSVINAIDMRFWNVSEGGLSQGRYVECSDGNSAATNGGQGIAEIQSNAEAVPFLMPQGQTASTNLLAINLTFSAQTGANL